jgi:non-ribosomal peptide synthetase component F
MREQVVALANLLRARGVKPGDSVAVALPRSVFLTLALHGIVEAGAAWLPLDTGYPDDRLRMMLEDAKPSLLITTDEQLPRFSDLPIRRLVTTHFYRLRMQNRCGWRSRSRRRTSSLPPVRRGVRKG